MDEPKKDFNRVEGVYCTWLEYAGVRMLQIERVNGDCSVSKILATYDEAKVIAEALKGKL